MERLNGGLKDIFSTILMSEKTPKGEEHHSGPVPLVSIRGNGNVIAPGGTVHVVQTTGTRAANGRPAKEA